MGLPPVGSECWDLSIYLQVTPTAGPTRKNHLSNSVEKCNTFLHLCQEGLLNNAYRDCLVLSCLRMAMVVGKTVSGFKEILSIPCLTKNFAKSGKSDGPWPQMPILRLYLCADLITAAIIDLTASLRSS